MPFFSEEITADGVKSDIHDQLTPALAPHYIKKKGIDAFDGYVDAVEDVCHTLDAKQRQAKTYDDLKKVVTEFINQRVEFIDNANVTLKNEWVRQSHERDERQASPA